MRVRIHRHIIDLAGSGLVLVGFLLAAMALSAVPILMQQMGRHSPHSQPGGAPDRSGISGTPAP